MQTLPSRSFHHQGQRANTLLMVLLAIAVLSVIASNLMWSATTRYHTTYQSASWQEALVASEAGVNLAMGELRTRVKTGNNYAFQSPWVSGNATAPTGAKAATPVDKRLLGGALDPTTVASCYDPVSDPSASHPISLTPVYPENGHALPLYNVANHTGEGNTQMWARVYVDVPGSLPAPATGGINFAAAPTNSIDVFMNEQSDLVGYDARSFWWYRIRSLGVTGLSGPARAGSDHRDNLLRHFSFFTDWRSNLPVNSFGPQVSRLVEAIAKPLTGFRNAIMADVGINLNDQSVLVDSYNSVNGLYGATYSPSTGQTATNTGTMGNIATNGTLINAGGAVVQGDAMTDDGSVENADNVSGNRRSDFYQELTKVPPPASGPPTTFTLDGLSLNGVKGASTSGSISYDGLGGYTVPASSDPTRPTRVYLNGIDLTNNSTSMLELTGAPDSSSTYIKVIVNGDIHVNDSKKTNGSNAIIIDKGVHAIIYVTGNVVLNGAGIANQSQVSGNLLINGVQPATAGATPPVIQILSTQDFQGIIYAPDHDLTLALQAVTINGTGGGGTSGSPTEATKDQIKNLQDQIKNDTKAASDADKQVSDLQQDMQKNPVNTYVDLGRIAYYQGVAASDRSLAATLQLQLNKLTTNNIIPDNSSQVTDHANGYNGIYGAFVAHSITVGSKTHVHYDEALRQAGPVNHYSLTNWLEDNASHSLN